MRPSRPHIRHERRSNVVRTHTVDETQALPELAHLNATPRDQRLQQDAPAGAEAQPLRISISGSGGPLISE
jgi:hypothetical protein